MFSTKKVKLKEILDTLPTVSELKYSLKFLDCRSQTYSNLKNFRGWEHRAVHQLYGLMTQRATYEGQLKRDSNSRPFVLSRAFFVGTQRWGPIWTGDNAAEWSHLKSSIPMLLSLGISGMPFVGADVGGFFGNPDAELVWRWYQIGAMQPFFRAHAHLDSKRREPWVFEEPWTGRMRNAIRMRYFLELDFYLEELII